MTITRESERMTLAEILKFIQESKHLSEADRKDAAKAVETVAKEGSPASKRGLIDVLKRIQGGSTALAGVAEQLNKFIVTVSQWF